MPRILRPAALRLLPAITLALLAAPGCAADVEQPYDAQDPGAFEVGTGERAFSELAPDATVPITAGGQGGYHIWVSVRCGTCGPDLAITYGVEDADTGDPITQPGLQTWATLQEQDGWREITGLTAFLSGFDASPYQGRRALFFARAAADDGTPLEAAAEATLSGIDDPL